ncbi:MAG TPA: HEAT repeat domain-containing protein [Vicinamibacterales bacterium]|nr:HEAT repeat domain-containing protein [Vicinamibacterales bacterium]
MKTIATLVLLGLATTASAQPPSIQNGKVETRKPAALDREIATIAATATTEPVWVGWRVPIVDGERGGCSTWVDNDFYFRGQILDYAPIGSTVPTARPQQITPPTGALPLEGGTGLVILLRLIDARVERMHRLADDCPIDAGGRTVYWLDGVTPGESLRVLDGYTREDVFERLSINARRNLTRAALEAIALHRDAGANPILDRIATTSTNSELRQQAVSLLGSRRGAHGFAMLQKLLQGERVSATRVELVNAIGQTRESGTVGALRGLLKDTDAKVRAAAVYYFAIRGGQPVVSEVTAILDNDPDNNVRRRAVSGLARLPAETSIPMLIQIARTNKNPEVQKQAVSALSQSKDPRAIAYMEEILR